MRYPSSWFSRIHLASGRRAPFIHGGTAPRSSISAVIGTRSPSPGNWPPIWAPTSVVWTWPSIRIRHSPNGSTISNDSGPAPRRRGSAVGAARVVDGARPDQVEHAPVGEGDVDLDVVGVPLVGDRLDPDAGEPDAEVVGPDPRVDRLAHLGVVGLRRPHQSEVVLEASGQVDRHLLPPGPVVHPRRVGGEAGAHLVQVEPERRRDRGGRSRRGPRRCPLHHRSIPDSNSALTGSPSQS